MTPNVNFSLSESQPKQLTSSLVDLENINLHVLEYLSSGSSKYLIPATKHDYESKVFFFWDVDKYVSLLSLLGNGANESSLEQFTQSLVKALYESENANISVDLINLFPQYIFLDPTTHDVKLVVTPVNDATPNNLRAFFDEFRSVIPFNPNPNTKLSALFKYLDATSLFSLGSLYNALFTDQASEQTPESAPPQYSATPVSPTANSFIPADQVAIPESSLPNSVTPIYQNQNLPNLNLSSQVTPTTLPEMPQNNGVISGADSSSFAVSNTPSNTKQGIATLTDSITGRGVKINHVPFKIGRHPQLVDFLLENPYVSGEHVRIERNNFNQYALTDLNSSNGTFVNSVRAIPESLELLSDGDTIKIADQDFIFNTQ